MPDYSLLFEHMGYSVFPVQLGSKQPAVKWSEYQQRRAPTELVEFWFNQNFNLGVVTGYNNLLVIDFDSHTEYARWLSWIGRQPNYAVIRRAFTVRSNRGVHVYLRTLQPERNRHIDKIDIKAQFGYVVGPGSTHPSGTIYTALNEFFVPTIGSLSDALPPSLLLSKQEVTPIIKPIAMPANDVWQSVNAPGVAAGMDLISAIRAKFKIEDFFTTPLLKTGSYFVVTNCPFHNDQKPSFWIDVKNQVCGCFVCNFGKPMDVCNLAASLYGLSNTAAIQALGRLI